MTTRPRDVREDAKKVLANALPHLGTGDPEYIALGLLAALDGARVGLVDLTPPDDPNADWRPPPGTIPAAADTPGTTAYQQARAALRATTEPQEGRQ